MRLNDMGRVVADEWVRSAALRTEIMVDAWVVMPNHLHGIIVIESPSVPIVGAYGHTPLRSPSRTLGAMVRGFKSAVTTRINECRGTPGKPVWQRNFYEHIVRNEASLNRIRQYMWDNPARWAFDRQNPVALEKELAEELDELEGGLG